MAIDVSLVQTCVLIVVARIVDVSLGTLRVITVIQGRRALAFVLGFVEVLVWVFAVAQVITNLTHPLVAVCYAFGFACGNVVGMTIESWFALGEQVVRIFTRMHGKVAAALREQGWRVTEMPGEGRDGPIYLLFVQAPRRDIPRTIEHARTLDPACYYVVDDVRSVSSLARSRQGSALRASWQRK